MDQQTLIDLAVEHNLAPGDYFALWDDLGLWQIDTLRSLGMQPRHRLLDVGCGAMRLGLFAIEYLDDGNYYGVDAFAPYLALARRLAEHCKIDKRYQLAQSESFGFGQFGQKFDYAMAQSVLTHLSAQQSEACFAALSQCMVPGGLFVATYLVGAPKTQGFLYGSQQAMWRSAIPDRTSLENLGARHGFRFERLSIPHPTGQEVAGYRYVGTER